MGSRYNVSSFVGVRRGETGRKMVGSVGSPIRKSQSLARLHKVSSPSQITAKKLVRKYSLPQFRIGAERKELGNLRTSLPHMRQASDLDLVLEAITYIENLQDRVKQFGQDQDHGANGHPVKGNVQNNPTNTFQQLPQRTQVFEGFEK